MSSAAKAVVIAARAARLAKLAKEGKNVTQVMTFDELLAGARASGSTLDVGVDAVNTVAKNLQGEAEFSRRVGITDPKTDIPAPAHQTQNTEEFANRLKTQLRDPAYAAKNTFRNTPRLREQELVVAQAFHENNVRTILKPLNANPRWKAAADEWWQDSPYKGEVQFHTDRHSDPTGRSLPIQFDDPWEFGIHSGTNAAAESTIHRGGIDVVMKNAAEQEQAIIQIAGELDLTVRDVEQTMAQATEAHFLNKFTDNANYYIWDQVEELVSEFGKAFGAEPGATNQFIQGLRGMPTPNTTPFLFRGKNGLLLEDNGGFKAQGVGSQLQSIFNNAEDIARVDMALGASTEGLRQKELIKFIESKGFDHITYFNSVEDKGSLSIINWNPDLMVSPWARELHRGPAGQAKAASQYVLGVLGLGGADAIVRDKEQGGT